MNRRRYFYVGLLPLLFAVNSVLGFHYPGGEYATWGAGSFPGIWAAIIKGGDIKGLKYPVAVGGALIMAFIGWRMDKMPVKKGIWLGSVVGVPAAIWIGGSLTGGFPKIETLEAVFGLLGVGLWLGSLVAIVIAFVVKNLERKPANPNTPL